ncbi:unnamed protein product [Microthlaspi erraticum]|uniref:High-affinity nitrate transporter n=1 Tax=Microthlaspi erraticum TaxID=1685480 RepID=A0A6D2JLE1_9BRAS|nr:unnamed protein product [Microthlaspi erraticum]
MALHTLFFVSLLIFSLAGSILVFTLIDSSRGATKLFSDLQNSLEVTAKPIRDGVVLEPGKDMVRITWKLKSSAKVDADAAFKTVEVKLCYAPISQDDRPWRMTHNELYKDKTCPYKIVSKPYDKIPQSLNWTLDLDIPTGTYFVRAYAKDAKGHEVAYGQSTDAEKTTNLFSVEAISGCHLLLDIASMFFSVFSVVSLFVFFVKAKKNSRVRTQEVS